MSLPQDASSGRLFDFALVLALLAALVSLFPGSAPFIWDEPMLILAAHNFNAARRFADVGLFGSLRLPYGPLPIWVYQVLLLLSHDLVWIMWMRILLFMSLLGGSVYWLARSTGWWRWGGLAALLSPYVYLYARQLWDNSMNIPLGMLSLAAYGAFVAAKTGRARSLCLFVATLTASLMLLVHLMALPAFIAFLSVLLLWHRTDLRRHVGAVALALLAAGILSGPYLIRFFSDDNLTGLSAIRAAWSSTLAFPLTSPRLLSGVGLDFFFRTPPETEAGLRASYLHAAGLWSSAFRIAGAFSLLSFAFIAFAWLYRLPLLWRPADSPALALTRLAVLTLLLQALFTLLTAQVGESHYFNAVVPHLVLLAWCAMDGLARSKLYRPLAVIYLTSLAVLTFLLAYRLIHTQGTRSISYGPTLSNQVSLAQQLRSLPSNHQLDDQTTLFPINRIVHNTLASGSIGQPPTDPPQRYLLRFTLEDPLQGGRMELIRLPDTSSGIPSTVPVAR